MRLEKAFAKVNLVLHVGPPRPDGLHELSSLLASIDLADEVEVEEAEDGEDRVVCPGVAGDNLAADALRAFRSASGVELPALQITIRKRIPVAAGLGGGSADAGAVLRAASELAGHPLGRERLRDLATGLGSDVWSQVEPRHWIVTGAGEGIEPIELSQLALVLVPQEEGLATRDVYAEFDRLGLRRATLDPTPLRRLAGAPVEALAAAAENDLEPAALSLRPELADVLADLRENGALAAFVSGSGPTCVGLFADLGDAQLACSRMEEALVAVTRQ
jgi:4-diphosphocytidyl-2-C-methyl-D-erythritol kinase